MLSVSNGLLSNDVELQRNTRHLARQWPRCESQWERANVPIFYPSFQPAVALRSCAARVLQSSSDGELLLEAECHGRGHNDVADVGLWSARRAEVTIYTETRVPSVASVIVALRASVRGGRRISLSNSRMPLIAYLFI